MQSARAYLSAEELELMDVQAAMEEQLAEQCSQVREVGERVQLLQCTLDPRTTSWAPGCSPCLGAALAA